MRGAPQLGFSATIRKIRARTSLLTRFRPPTRLNPEIHVQYKRNPARCQFTTVRGVTKTRGPLLPDQNVLSATQNSLCRAVNRLRGRCACKASSCRRRAKFSRTRSPRERKRADDPPEEMPEPHNHGKNIIGTIRIQLCAKSFILRVYNVLARHRQRLRVFPKSFASGPRTNSHRNRSSGILWTRTKVPLRSSNIVECEPPSLLPHPPSHFGFLMPSI